MTNPTLIVEKTDGTKYDLQKLGIWVIKFEPPSAAYNFSTVQIGKYGQRLVGTTVSQRQIPFQCDVIASNDLTIITKRNDFFNIFNSMEPFYITDMRLPTIRWKVVAEQQPFELYNNWHMGGDISFNVNCVDGYAESVDTTLNIGDLSKWSFGGMNLPKDRPLKYRFNTNSFEIFNASNIDILAEERPYNILFKGAASNLTINNLTTRQCFKCYKSISKTDEFVLRGVWPIINNKSVYSQTNHAFIDLKKGWNKFQIDGCTSDFEIAFNTHFYY